MIDSNPRIKTRTSLFFGQWQFCGQFYLLEANALRGLDHAHIDHIVQIRKRWSRSINFGGSWNNRYAFADITEKVIEDLHGMCDFLSGDTTPKKTVLHANHLYVYTNDLNLLDRIKRTDIGQLIETTQAQVAGQPGTLLLKNPRYQYRTYLRETRLEPHVADSVQRFLKNQQDVRLSPSLKWWIDQGYYRALSYYFIDHDDPGVLTMLSMIDPKLIRKTVPISAAK